MSGRDRAEAARVNGLAGRVGVLPAELVAEAGAVAVQLDRAKRALVRAIQDAEDGDGRELTYILSAELDVAGVGVRLARIRRAVALAVMGSAEKVQDSGAP